MKFLRIVISSYLAFCLAFSGAIGLSPILHLLIEHDGHGEGHSHIYKTTHSPQAYAHRHEPAHQQIKPSEHSSRPAHRHSHSGEVHRHNHRHHFHHHSHGIAHLQDRLEHWLSHTRDVLVQLFSQPADHPASGPTENAEHHHHSLPQMMCSGIVEQAIDSPQWIYKPATLLIASFRFEELLLEHRWNPQSAGRAPPKLQRS